MVEARRGPWVDIFLTATQLETFWREEKDSCRRRWWFKYVRRLPTVQRSGGAFGDVLHAVLERYLNADHRGVDPKTGFAVDLYPKGWDTPVDRYSGQFGALLSPVEANLIRSLISEALDRGLLYRPPNRMVEVHFEHALTLPSGRSALLRGDIDMIVPPDLVWDHKSHKSMKYARSKPKMKTSPQMLSYALALYRGQEAAGVKLDGVHLKHLVFAKEEGRVRETPGYATAEEILAFESKLKERADEMLDLKAEKTTDEVWPYVPGPEPKSRACLAYGGCPFAGICSGDGWGETAAEYRARFVKENPSSAP
jgi:hypothetical protein